MHRIFTQTERSNYSYYLKFQTIQNTTQLHQYTSITIYKHQCAYLTQFARIHTSSLINTEKILNRPITKFYNGDDVNMIAAELRLTKTRPISFYIIRNIIFYKKQCQQM